MPHDINVCAAQPVLPHCTSFFVRLDDEFVTLEAVGWGEDAGQVNFGHRRRPLGDLTMKLQPLDVAVDDSRDE
jgi:hypothetical protein